MSIETFSAQLQLFTSSPKSFEILNPSSRSSNDDTIYILDSSFNPPTKAHLALSICSLPASKPSTVLLLLAIQNADKPTKPASFSHRLAMMALLSHEIEHTSSKAIALIALSKHPRFVDKAKDVITHFPSTKEVVWLVGYDTLIRILDKKYYVDTLEKELGAFWEKNRLICAIRGDDTIEREYVERISRGEVAGVPKEWAEYITIIEPVGKEDSSTRARKAAKEGNWEDLRKVVPVEIAEYVQRERLYLED